MVVQVISSVNSISWLHIVQVTYIFEIDLLCIPAQSIDPRQMCRKIMYHEMGVDTATRWRSE